MADLQKQLTPEESNLLSELRTPNAEKAIALEFERLDKLAVPTGRDYTLTYFRTKLTNDQNENVKYGYFPKPHIPYEDTLRSIRFPLSSSLTEPAYIWIDQDREGHFSACKSFIDVDKKSIPLSLDETVAALRMLNAGTLCKVKPEDVEGLRKLLGDRKTCSWYCDSTMYGGSCEYRLTQQNGDLFFKKTDDMTFNTESVVRFGTDNNVRTTVLTKYDPEQDKDIPTGTISDNNLKNMIDQFYQNIKDAVVQK